MRKFCSTLVLCVLLTSCQSTEDTLATDSAPVRITGSAASAIAGDMAGKLAEHVGPTDKVSIQMEKDKSEFSAALETALKGWGFAIVQDGKNDKTIKPMELAYSMDSVDGQILARLWTSSVAISRVYAPTAAGASPVSPLSKLQVD